MFHNLVFSFNNEEIKVTLPEAVYNLPNVDEINANDMTRICISRYCKDVSIQVFDFVFYFNADVVFLYSC